MRGTRIGTWVGLATCAAALLAVGCKNRQGSGTAADATSVAASSADPKESSEIMAEPKLEDTYWVLVELGERVIAEKTPGQELFLELSSKKQSAYGFGGCNRFFGSYESSGESLSFGALGATRMACPEGMDLEQELFTALGKVTRYELDGGELRLLEGDALVARFEARPRPPD